MGNVQRFKLYTVCSCKCNKPLTNTCTSWLLCKCEWHQASLPSPAASRNTERLRCCWALTFALPSLVSPRFPFWSIFLLRSPDPREGADWRKAVPSYTQSNSNMDFRTWSSLPRDDSLEPLPLNWEMAYTETGMVYFIEWVKDTTHVVMKSFSASMLNGHVTI